MYILGYSGRMWVTKDGGENYEFYQSTLELEHLILHPTEPGWCAVGLKKWKESEGECVHCLFCAGTFVYLFMRFMYWIENASHLCLG